MKTRIFHIIACVAVIAAISFAFFYPDASQGRVLQQGDMMQGLANGQEITAWRDATGHTSWWTNSLFGGMPTFQISPSYPSTGLFSWLNAVYGLFLPSPCNLIAMMMLGMFILLLSLKVRPWTSLIGAIGWGLSSYFVIIIGAGHIWKFLALTYVPPTIAGLVLLFSGRRLLGAGVAALFMMLQIASNHVQMSYYFSWVMLGFIIAYGVSAYKEKTLKAWGMNCAIFAGAMLLAVAANSPNLYHTWKYSKETIRGGHSELVQPGSESTAGLDRDYITQYSYEKAETATLLIPDAKGGTSAKSLAESAPGKKMLAQHPQYAEVLASLPQYFGGEEGTSGPVYVGALIFALALFGAIAVRGPLKWALVILTLLSISLAWGRHMQWFTDLFISMVPMYAQFRTVESILVIAEFTLPVLAILGLCQLLTADDKKPMLKPLYVSFGICAAFCLLVAVAPGILGSDGMWAPEQQYIDYFMQAQAQGYDVSSYFAAFDAAKSVRMSLVSEDAWRSLLFIALGGAALLLCAMGKLRTLRALAIVGALVLADLYTTDKRYLNSDSFHDAQPRAATFTPSAADKMILHDDDPDFRVLSVPQFTQPAPSYFHKSVGGYHAAKLTRYNDLITAQLNKLYTDDPFGDEGFINTLNMLNVKYLIEDPNDEPIANPEALGNAWFVENIEYVDNANAEMAALNTFDPATTAVADAKFSSILGSASAATEDDEIYLTDYAPDRLEYQASTQNGGLAVFSEVYFPWGWNVTIDGKPAELGRVDYVLRALPIPAGDHVIVMEFAPRSIAVTNVIATAAIILTYLLLLGGIALTIRKRYVAR